METAEFLTRERQPIVDAAESALARSHARHYDAAGDAEVHRRLEALFDHLLRALTERDIGPIVAYAQKVAEDRFEAGYDLSEVQTAFNALEEATWARALSALDPSQFAEALGLVSTVLGSGKDALARRYVSLAAQTHAPSLDLRALFAGTEGV
jgi:RsbT co-antagonist protein rsbRD N-terminal domain